MEAFSSERVPGSMVLAVSTATSITGTTRITAITAPFRIAVSSPSTTSKETKLATGQGHIGNPGHGPEGEHVGGYQGFHGGPPGGGQRGGGGRGPR